MPSGLGTYFASGAIHRENAAKHPIRQGLLSVTPAHYFGESLVSNVGGGLDARKTDPFAQLRKETAGQSAWRRAKPGALAGGIGGGLLGALIGALTHRETADPAADIDLPALLKSVGLGASGGVVSGGLAGGAVGGFGGAYDNLVTALADRGSQDAARRMKAEHPLLTALPFGDMVGASFYGGGAQLKENYNKQREKQSSDTSMQNEFEQAVMRGFQKQADWRESLNSLRDVVQGKSVLTDHDLSDLLQRGAMGGLVGGGIGGLAGYGLGSEPDEKTGKGGNKKLLALLGALGGAGVGAAGAGLHAFSGMEPEEASMAGSRASASARAQATLAALRDPDAKARAVQDAGPDLAAEAAERQNAYTSSVVNDSPQAFTAFNASAAADEADQTRRHAASLAAQADRDARELEQFGPDLVNSSANWVSNLPVNPAPVQNGANLLRFGRQQLAQRSAGLRAELDRNLREQGHR